MDIRKITQISRLTLLCVFLSVDPSASSRGAEPDLFSAEPEKAAAIDQRRAVALGRRIFLDTGLSNPPGQGCVSCHQPNHAFADPRPVSPGAVSGRQGTRNSPSLMYAALIPPFAYDEFFTEDGEEVYAWEGGLFHDGRARDLFEQVQQPFLDSNEMNLPNEQALVDRIRKADYANDFQAWVGDEIWRDDTRLAYHVYRSLVEFLKEPMFRPFDSRLDDYLAGQSDALTPAERRGLDVFRNKGKCASCHFLQSTNWQQPLLSDFGYDNLGVPSRGSKDPGLGRRTKKSDQLGQFRAPSLRNIQLTAPYMHNGSIATVREVIEFYNKRDLEPKRWGKTDYPETVNRSDFGNLKLTDQQVTDLIDLMDAFTDRTLLKMAEKGFEKTFPNAPKGRPSTAEIRLYFPDWTHRLHRAYPGKMD